MTSSDSSSDTESSRELTPLETRTLRLARPEDAHAIAAVLTAARAEQAFMPPLHTPQEDRWFVAERMLPANEVWVVEEAGEIVGFASIGDAVLGHLYVTPRAQGRGVGSALLDKVKQRRATGFTLWTHQPNVQARAFYERRGLEAVEFTDGQGNEERVPDVRYRWEPPTRQMR